MELLEKIRLSWRWGRVVYIVSAVLSLTLASVVLRSPVSIPFCFIIKAVSIPVIHYLNLNFNKGLGIYFYLNLGISRREYHAIPFVLDFIAFIILITVTGVIGYAV